MDLTEIENGMARLDALYRPVARAPIDLSDPDAFTNMGAVIAERLAALGGDADAQAVLESIIEMYANGDRIAIRELFDGYPSFRWAAHLPRDWSTADEFRAHLIHLSARDQGADSRDEILTLQALCEQARQHGIDVAPILDEVAAMSSDVDRYGMGSMREIIRDYGRR
jgi:hypothetical protein